MWLYNAFRFLLRLIAGIWFWLNKYYGVLGLIAIVAGVWTLVIEQKKFDYEYGPQAELVFSGSTLVAQINNDLVSNLRVRTTVYLQLSDERFKSINSQYIELQNYLECVGEWPGSSICYTSWQQKPRTNNSIYGLELLFNKTPTKLYPSIVCVSSLEYTNPKNEYQRQWYLTEGCDPVWEYERRHFRLTESELKELFDTVKVIGKVDFALAGPIGIVDPIITRQLLNILMRERWKVRFVESSALRWYRTVYFYGGGDIVKWRSRNGLSN